LGFQEKGLALADFLLEFREEVLPWLAGFLVQSQGEVLPWRTSPWGSKWIPSPGARPLEVPRGIPSPRCKSATQVREAEAQRRLGLRGSGLRLRRPRAQPEPQHPQPLAHALSLSLSRNVSQNHRQYREPNRVWNRSRNQTQYLSRNQREVGARIAAESGPGT